MKKIIAIIIMLVVGMCGVAGCATVDNANAKVEQLQKQILKLQKENDELSDANERLADMYTDIEFENKELRKVNDALIADNAALANQPAQVEYIEVPAQDDFIECGACGAHVHDWYYIRNADDTAFVEVCQYCYENCL